MLAALGVAVAGCAPSPEPMGRGPSPELRWYRDLAIDDAGGDIPAMHVDPGGGLWVAVTGVSSKTGRSRLYHHSPEGGWKTLYEGPFATEPSLSSVRAGEVFFGHNLPLDQFRPRLLRVSQSGVTPEPAPDQRLDELEYVQVGGYAMLGDDEGFACGQRGSVWRRAEGKWTPMAPALAWKQGDSASKAFCRAMHFEDRNHGALVDFEGNGALWDGAAWKRVARDGSRELAGPVPIAIDGRRLLRYEGSGWVELAGELSAGTRPVLDERGRWAASPGGLVSVGDRAISARRGKLPFTPRAIAEAGGVVWALASDGVYRSTREDVPTFADAAGAIPRGILHAIAVDLDQDGDLDLLGLVARSGDGVFGPATLVAEMNDGSGHFSAARVGLPDDVVLWRDRMDVGDVDGDGDVDVVVTNVAGEVVLYRHDGARFVRAWAVRAPDATVALVDVDGDGDLDLSVIPAVPGLYLNDGAGRFTVGPEVPMPATRTEHVAWADADGDGDVDAVLQHWRDPAHLLRNDGGRFTLIELPVVAEGAAWEDLDRRGSPELCAQKVHVRGVALPFARCRVEGAGCAADAGIAVPAGLVVDLNLDGQKDVIATDLRGDEAMTSDGEVFVRDGQGFSRVTQVTGAMPRPVAIDADGDGDPDVYSPALGLRINTADAASFVRVRPRASRSDRLARGAWVIARRAGDAAIVATGAARSGEVTLGLPDATARYDLEIRFPAGEKRVIRGAAAGTSIEVRDAEPAAYQGRLALLWVTGTAKRAHPLRDLGAPLAAAAIFVILSRRAKRPAPRLGRVAIPMFAIAWAALAGTLLRTGGASPWLLTPAAAAIAGLGEAAAIALARRRAARRAGPYTLFEKLGAGAAATVWRARAGKSEVALKLFSAESMAVGEARERFFREARIGSEIRHPNVVRIRDAGELEDGRCYLAMELVDGRSLAEKLRIEGPLPPARAATIGREVALALGALHAAGIVHRDVKPENVVLRADGSAVLTDLGLARSALFKTLTRHDVAVGTLAYMSPEQCVGRPLDGRSDLWSLGVVLYEMLSGKRPFSAEHELELVYVIHNIDPPPPSSIVPAVSASLDATVLRCLARAAEDRFASAAEVADALSEPVGIVSGTRPSAGAKDAGGEASHG